MTKKKTTSEFLGIWSWKCSLEREDWLSISLHFSLFTVNMPD